jgi:hypothetical protein
MSVFRVGSNKSSVNNFPSVRPTLDLDFANSKTLDSRITFTRASGGSYTGADGYIKFAGVNEARFDHDPYTGESLGLLIEESRTNLFPWSETFVSGWGGGGTPNTDTILNPYGVLGTVYYITVSEWIRNFNANGLSTLALSFFSKRRFGGLNRDFSYIEIFQQATPGGGLGVYSFRFDGNNPNSGQFQNIRTERYQNDWYRFSCTLVARPDYNGGVFGTSARVDLEGGVADNYFWGIQVESGAFPTSYIPTVASTRTRAADNASITGKNFSEWYRQDEGTVFVDFRLNTDGTARVFNIDDGTGNNRISGLGGSTFYQTFFLPGNRGPSITLPSSVRYKVMSAHKDYDVTNYLNENYFNSTTGRDIIIPKNLNTFRIGNWQNNTLQGTTIARLTYYPKRLPNAQLQALTK